MPPVYVWGDPVVTRNVIDVDDFAATLNQLLVEYS